ncbi:GH24959 [Drosophila grimshawi]|uniref:GH24959 n=1 Tax=Drosophila grimshawi TaxID=7222 RepID=B4K0E0_DROGR|nr:GH24959 [Drosophila grimshawi]
MALQITPMSCSYLYNVDLRDSLLLQITLQATRLRWKLRLRIAPTAIVFAVYAGIRSDVLGIFERIELKSDHIPLIVEYRVAAALSAPKIRLLPHKANITRFRQRLEQLVNLKMELSSPADIDDAAEVFLHNINVATEYSMFGQLPCSPPYPPQLLLKPEVLDLVRHKRALRRHYMRSLNPLNPRDFRRAAYELRKLLFDIKSNYFQDMLRNADPNKNRGFNSWKATRCVKRQPLRRIPIMRPDSTWCRSDAEIASAFANELHGLRITPFAVEFRLSGYPAGI